MPSNPTIPLSAPAIGGNEWVYAKECFDAGWVSSVGPFVDRFEREFAAFAGTSHAVACQSGTAALHVALIVAGVRANDEVIVPALTFIAPANAVSYAGAVPVLADVDRTRGLLDVHLVSQFLRNHCERRQGGTFNKSTRARISAIVPVHVLGHPADMDALMELAEEFQLVIVEDATESLGSTYKGRSAGAVGHIGCFSFNGNKIMTTGGGGMIVTDNDKWAQRAKHLTHQAKVDPVEYEHDEIGFNYRLTNVQAAMGVAQLEQMPKFLDAKRKIAARYCEAFASLSGVTPIRPSNSADTNWWLFTVLVEPEKFGMSSRDLMHSLAAKGIQSRPLWRPLHLGPPHEGRQLIGDGSAAQYMYRLALSLPCSTNLSQDDQTRVVEAVRDAAGS